MENHSFIDPPVVKIAIDPTEKKKKKKKIRYSSFYITLNTNTKYEDAILFEKAELLESILKRILSADQIIQLLVPREEGVELNAESVKKITSQAGIEVGETNGFLHAHILIEVSHYTKIHLNYNLIAEKIKQEMDLPHLPYIYSRLYKNVGRQLEDYLFKNVKK